MHQRILRAGQQRCQQVPHQEHGWELRSHSPSSPGPQGALSDGLKKTGRWEAWRVCWRHFLLWRCFSLLLCSEKSLSENGLAWNTTRGKSHLENQTWGKVKGKITGIYHFTILITLKIFWCWIGRKPGFITQKSKCQVSYNDILIRWENLLLLTCIPRDHGLSWIQSIKNFRSIFNHRKASWFWIDDGLAHLRSATSLVLLYPRPHIFFAWWKQAVQYMVRIYRATFGLHAISFHCILCKRLIVGDSNCVCFNSRKL